jgi:hypothetical protein
MSYDLHVLSKRRPKPGLVPALASMHGVSISGNAVSKPNGQLLLDAVTGTHVEIDGPLVIEKEDVPEAATGAIADSGWVLMISVKGSVSVEWPQGFAIEAARAVEGVVYDPQQDAVIWPKAWRPGAAENGRDVIDEIELGWSIIRASDDPYVPARFLKLLREHYPNALPRRYGSFEPLPHRFIGEHADHAFAEAWAEESLENMPFFFWSSTRPCFGGHVAMTSASPSSGELEHPCVSITLNFDARSCYRDRAATEMIVNLFRLVSYELECVYAGAWVLRGVLLPKGGNAAYRGGPEVGPMPRGGAWVGLPAGPTWLAWFGKPYAELVRPAIASHISDVSERGIFMRLGAEPLGFDELTAQFPPLPAALLARRPRRRGRWLDGAPYTHGSLPPSEPAELIPAIA